MSSRVVVVRSRGAQGPAGAAGSAGPAGATGPTGTGGVSALANDVASSTGTNIDRMRGQNGIPFVATEGDAITDLASPPVGGAWTYNARNSVVGFRGKKPVMPGYYDVEDYGAVGDYSSGRTGSVVNNSAVVTLSPNRTGMFVGKKIWLVGDNTTRTILSLGPAANQVTLTATVSPARTNVAVYTDNADAITAWLAAGNTANRTSKYVIDGQYFTSQELTLTQTCIIEGTGNQYWASSYSTGAGGRTAPGTVIAFPKDVTGIRIKSSYTGDPGGYAHGASWTKISDLTLVCIDTTGTIGHGVFASAECELVNVTADYFRGNGFHIASDVTGLTGNTDLTILNHCYARGNYNGFHIEGDEANACRVFACNAFANRNVGFYDATGNGGTGYMFCHATANTLYNYQSTGSVCSFIHCYNESSNNCSFTAGTIVWGGNLSSGGATIPPAVSTSAHFDLQGSTATGSGVMRFGPLEHLNTRGARNITARLGELRSLSDMSFLSFDVLGTGTSTTATSKTDCIYGGDADPWLVWRNGRSGSLEIMRLPTERSNARTTAPWLPYGTMLGIPTTLTGNGGATQTRVTSSVGTSGVLQPKIKRSSAPQSYDVGDIVLNGAPTTGSAVLYRCITAGTLMQTNPSPMPTGEVLAAGTLTVSNASYIEAGQYISVTGLSAGATKKITEVTGTTATYTPATGTVAAGAAIVFVAPTFETVGGSATAETLSNKTLDAPVIAPTVAGLVRTETSQDGKVTTRYYSHSNTTPDATPTSIISAWAPTLADEAVHAIELEVQGIKSDGSAAAFYWIRYNGRRDGGTWTALAVPTYVIPVEETTGGWDCVLTVASNKPVVTVTGEGATVRWGVAMSIRTTAP